MKFSGMAHVGTGDYGDEGMIGTNFDNMHEITFTQLSWWKGYSKDPGLCLVKSHISNPKF
jgi:hypothetical protein